MIIDQSLVLVEEKPEFNVFGREKGYIDTLLRGPVVDFMYKKDETTWAMSWYDFNLHLLNIPGYQELVKKFNLFEYFYSGPNTGKKTDIVYPSAIGPRVGYLSLGGLDRFNRLSINLILSEWFTDSQRRPHMMIRTYYTNKGYLSDVRDTQDIMRDDNPFSPLIYDLLIRRYFTVLSEEEKEIIWDRSGYAKRLCISSWQDFKEIYYDA